MNTPAEHPWRIVRKRERRRVFLLSAACLAAFVAAYWILPCRAAFGPNGYLYSFALFPDEFAYAWRTQPLIAGTTATNVVNRFHDPTVISPFFLDDAVRVVLTVTRVPVPWAFWIWRFAFPLAIAGVVWGTMGAFLASGRRPWGAPLRCAAALAATGVLFVVSHLITDMWPIAPYLDRIPTNLEYPFAFVLAWAWLRLATAPSVCRGMIVAALGALLLYIRPYAAIGWGLALAAYMVYGIVRRTLPLRVWLATGATVLVLLAPWVVIGCYNSRSGVYVEMFDRFYQHWPYHVHKRWPVYIGVAALFGAMAWRVRGAPRAMLGCMALTTASLPFISGLFREAQELLLYERYGSFYAVGLVLGAVLVLSAGVRARCGSLAAALARRAATACLLLSLLSSGALAAWHACYGFEQNAWTQLTSLYEDRKHIPAYEWIAEHTPPDALFLVDDGYDWSVIPPFTGRIPLSHKAPDGAELYQRADHFQLIARRQRVHNEWLWAFALGGDEYVKLMALQRGTFGYPIPSGHYVTFLKQYRPNYVFWRRTAPIPRGYGRNLQMFRTIVYADAACELWQLDFSKFAPDVRAP